MRNLLGQVTVYVNKRNPPQKIVTVLLLICPLNYISMNELKGNGPLALVNRKGEMTWQRSWKRKKELTQAEAARSGGRACPGSEKAGKESG